MRVGVLTTCVLALSAAAPCGVRAQKIGAPMLYEADATHRVVVRSMATPPGVAQADSLAARDTHAEAGAIMGGLIGAAGGAVAFAHWTHRAGAVNSGTGTLGGAVVGAGVLGGVGALAGLLIGSAIPR